MAGESEKCDITLIDGVGIALAVSDVIAVQKTEASCV
jgi:hypothetical protein